MITFFECGQGDASFIDDVNFKLFVDLGARPFSGVNHNSFDLMISHSHVDHINGFSFQNGTTIGNLYVPAYFPEYVAIIKKLRNRPVRGRRVNVPIIPPRNRRIPLYDGKQLYGGKITVCNPPLNPWDYWGVDVSDENWFDEINRVLSLWDMNLESLLEEAIAARNEMFNDEVIPDGYDSRKFVFGMLGVMVNNYASGRWSVTNLSSNFKKYNANMLSIVFSYEDGEKKYLFTGDAEWEVYCRIICGNHRSLKCDFLKVPHHGSNTGLKECILRSMDPDAAVISHDNGRFASSSDSHPHKEILCMLKNNNVIVYPTNDIIKKGQVIYQAHHGLIPGFNAEIQ